MQAIVQDTNASRDKSGKPDSFGQKPNLLIIDEIDGASSGGGNDVSKGVLIA